MRIMVIFGGEQLYSTSSTYGVVFLWYGWEWVWVELSFYSLVRGRGFVALGKVRVECFCSIAV